VTGITDDCTLLGAAETMTQKLDVPITAGEGGVPMLP
jgi:hypothetical protein